MAEGGMEGERKGNRGAHSAGEKSALSSSFHLSSISLSHFAPASLTQLYPFTTKPKLSPLLSLSHFASCSLSPPSIPLPVVSPFAHHLPHLTTPSLCLSQTI